MSPNNSWRKLAGVGLVISLAVILMAFCTARARYESRLRQQLWPAHAPEISALSSPAVASIPTVMLLGDSRMAQWGLPELRHWRVVNAGMGGLTTGQVRLAAPELLEKYRPDVIVLQAGINDLKFLGLRPELISTVVSLATSNLTAIVSAGARRNCQVIVLETWPAGQPDWARRLVWNAAIPASVNQLNAELRKLNAPGQGIRVVDLFGEAGLEPGLESYRDTLHFTPETYQRLTPALQKALDDARRKTKTLL
jgi:lysophospholipase L1-like esterase